MTPLSDAQIEFIAKVEKSAAKCAVMAAEAERLNLKILARALYGIQKELKEETQYQCRAFRENDLSQGNLYGDEKIT